MVSESKDETDKFWKYAQGQWNWYQTLNTDNFAFTVSFNETENK